MPIVADFVQIVGDNPVTIGDADRVWEATFSTGGRESGRTGFLIFNLRDLTHTNLDVVVSLNGQEVGRIRHYFPGGPGVNPTDINDPHKQRHRGHWYTQMIAFTGSQINNGSNRIQIEAVEFPGNTGNNRFDDFQIKDMMCFFHQNA